MAAPRNIHPGQFKLFMGGQEWQNSVVDSVDLAYSKKRTMKGLWKEKLGEAKQPASSGGHGAGVYESMKEYGYYHDIGLPRNKPTTLVNYRNELTQSEGHHRIAAAA